MTEEGCEPANVVFRYVPETWDDDRFARTGGFVAVVLNYNKKGLIGPAARSALGQKDECYEVLMLDDCSSDGSEREMLAEAEAYAARKGACKVTVVVNRRNRMTTGQWNLAARLSSGTWFGMFCGDDVSRPDRLSVARAMVAEHPTALGIATDFRTSRGDLQFGGTSHGVWRGTDPYIRGLMPVSGCAAWWHRRVIENDLQPFVLDDFLLVWVTMILRKGSPDVALAWDYRHVTVDYSVGTGVSTELQQLAARTRLRFFRIWREYIAQREHKRRYDARFRAALLDYARRFSRDASLLEDLEHPVYAEMMFEMSWLERLLFYVRYRFVRGDRTWDFLYWRMFLGALSYALVGCLLAWTYRFRHPGRR
jgi:glycosyltransferase involved in cell wall biosynthesis